eukprot:5378705-Amphidinium_carterae.2
MKPEPAPPSGPSGSASSAGDAPPLKRARTFQSLEEMKDKQTQAAFHGYEIGATVAFKECKDQTLHTIQAFNDSTCVLAEIGKSAKTKEVSMQELMQLYKVKMHKPAVALQCDILKHGPLHSEAFQIELAKASIHLAMKTCLERHGGNEQLVEIFTKPTSVRTTQPIPAKGLKLVGASMRIDRKGGANAIGVGSLELIDGKVNFYVHPHFSPPSSGEGKQGAATWVVPFWCIQQDGSKANMALGWEQEKVQGQLVCVPVLTNPLALKTGQILYMKKHDDAVLPTKGAKGLVSLVQNTVASTMGPFTHRANRCTLSHHAAVNVLL